MSNRPWSLCVYCASGPVDEQYLELASTVGTEIGRRGWRLVSGGGKVSMMGALARSARAAGASTLGVIPRALVDREVADLDADELLITDTMRERKALMDAHSDAFLTLPGGIGTLEELFETWTAGYLGIHDKPVTVLDPGGHYSGLLTWLDGLRAGGFVSAAALDRLRIRVTLAEAFDAVSDRGAQHNYPINRGRFD